MRYVIVSVIKGKAGEFNNSLREEVFRKFKAKSSKLPAHFTIKAPFEYEGSINELQSSIESFCLQHEKSPINIEGYNHFGNRVIYMDTKLSEYGKEIHDGLIDTLHQFKYLVFKPNEGKNKVFHITVASKNIQGIFQELWQYVSERPCSFVSQFDNVSIYRWENNTWVLHKEFKFM